MNTTMAVRREHKSSSTRATGQLQDVTKSVSKIRKRAILDVLAKAPHIDGIVNDTMAAATPRHELAGVFQAKRKVCIAMQPNDDEPAIAHPQNGREARARQRRLAKSHSFAKFATASLTTNTWFVWFVKLIEWGLANALSLPLTNVEQFADLCWGALVGFVRNIGKFSSASAQDPASDVHVCAQPLWRTWQ